MRQGILHHALKSTNRHPDDARLRVVYAAKAATRYLNSRLIKAAIKTASQQTQSKFSGKNFSTWSSICATPQEGKLYFFAALFSTNEGQMRYMGYAKTYGIHGIMILPVRPLSTASMHRAAT